jgi:hypothetical protein
MQYIGLWIASRQETRTRPQGLPRLPRRLHITRYIQSMQSILSLTLFEWLGLTWLDFNLDLGLYGQDTRPHVHDHTHTTSSRNTPTTHLVDCFRSDFDFNFLWVQLSSAQLSSIQSTALTPSAVMLESWIDSGSNLIMTEPIRFEWSFSRRHLAFALIWPYTHTYTCTHSNPSFYRVQCAAPAMWCVDDWSLYVGFHFDRYSMIDAVRIVRIIVSMPNSARIRIRRLSRQGLTIEP